MSNTAINSSKYTDDVQAGHFKCSLSDYGSPISKLTERIINAHEINPTVSDLEHIISISLGKFFGVSADPVMEALGAIAHQRLLEPEVVLRLALVHHGATLERNRKRSGDAADNL